MGIFVVFGAILFNMNSVGEFHLANQAVPSEKEIIDFWHSQVAPGPVPPAFIDYCKTFPSGEPIDRITLDRFKSLNSIGRKGQQPESKWLDGA